MRRILLCLLLLVAAPAWAEPIRLFDNALSFDLPSGFRPMTPVEIGVKYPKPSPQHAYTADDNLGVTIAVWKVPYPDATPEKLAATGASMQQDIAKRPGTKVSKHGVVSIGEAQWYAIDFASKATNVAVENRTRMGMRKGYFVLVTVNAVASLFPQREADMLVMLSSLKLD